jgi:hypothetical protein
MWLVNQTSTAARTALIYITVGALTVIWTLMWYVYLFNNPPETHSVYYWCTGFLVTGLTLVVIGLGLGRIGRSAQRADLPPEVPLAVVNVQPDAAAPVLAPPNLTPPVASPNGQVVLGPPQKPYAGIDGGRME